MRPEVRQMMRLMHDEHFEGAIRHVAIDVICNKAIGIRPAFKLLRLHDKM